ncbi:RmlC-like cupin domain-containing protein [Chytridium lagenaria]|nr:RmlC-like cupin domain-containing protein [Chytridium lagenaria]
MPLLPPINFPKWVSEHKHLLQPPTEQTPQIYHVQETEEWFYQHQGDMLLKVVDDGEFKDIEIKEGEMFLLPANVPHNPVRFADTIGIVIEVQRPPNSLGNRLPRIIHCVDLGTQLKPVIEKFAGNAELRKCKKCGFENVAK